MSLADLSIRRPTFITSVVIATLAVGYLSMKKLGVDLFPDVTFPVVTITTPYPGAGPAEVETLISKPLEDEISTLSGIRKLRSINREGVSIVVAEFTLETDVKYAEQQIRDRVGSTKRVLPKDIKEPVIRRVDPADQPIIVISLRADLTEAELFDVADNEVRPKIEQIPQVGLVEIIGGRKREIRVSLDRTKLKSHELSASQVAARLGTAGQNIPVGKMSELKQEIVLRSMGEFKHLGDIKSTIVNFLGNDIPVTVGDVGTVTDSLVDETSRAFVNGQKALLFYVFKQSGANTIAVADTIKAQMTKFNDQMKLVKGSPRLLIVRDASTYIRADVEEVQHSILMGILLTVLVVFYFLGNWRSTIITGLALPNSLIGAFILMAMAGFTINLMTLLALSLSVGLLIDDAIVVRENIFRYIEMGKPPIEAALEGTAEVRLAVIATTLTVIAVFLPIAFLKGVVGQFFKQFGLTVCFAMAISLFDALTIAPMLSAYFISGTNHEAGKKKARRSLNPIQWSLKGFEVFQDWLDGAYERVLRTTLKRPRLVLFLSTLVLMSSCASIMGVPKTFLPPQDAGEFMVSLEMSPGTNLETMNARAAEIDAIIRANSEVEVTSLTVGGRDGAANIADFYVHLVPSGKRPLNTSQVKQNIRDKLATFSDTNPTVKDYDAIGGGLRPFNIDFIGNDSEQLEKFTLQVFERIKQNPGLKDPEINFKPGKPELRIVIDKKQSETLGISSIVLGQELRTQIEGETPAKFRELGREYDIRVRLQEDQRNLKQGFTQTFVPNINGTLIKLSDVAHAKETDGPSIITRMDRSRYIEIGADISPGAGMGDIMNALTKMLTTDLKPPSGIRFAFTGQAEDFKQLTEGMALAVALSVIFIFLILASLYESFVTPLTIMVALPFAVCGSIFALFITGQSLNIFSMIGTVMLLGVATKNSILLVDYTSQLIQQGLSEKEALLKAGRTRLRPILMTTMALIAGTLPVALGLSETAKQRMSMGVAIIGGLISSTILTLVVVPAVYSDISKFRRAMRALITRIFLH